ncbi:f-box domain protein [Diplodia corticola]|uniref:F-box domain protein n=1 Tax=Diplodia corticola TaxID=236234 RepID=A0A1J9QZJ7_9PEZI|nr:f-box domain protein [Diplodia corticola]OJD33793.1 f-box domain protein [Diplodia corticola]
MERKKMASREKVLQTTELLELILFHLPMRDLLLAQRICKRFNDLIRHSTTLQQTLFFLPRPALPSSTPPAATTSSPPLRSFATGAITTEPWDRNPLLTSAFPPWFDRGVPARNRPRYNSLTRLTTLPLAATPAARDAFLRPDASWRNMFVTQPPLTALDRLNRVHSMEGDGARWGTLRFPHGVTMGVLYDATCEELLPFYDWAVGFGVQWQGARGRVVLVAEFIAQCTDETSEEETREWEGYYSRAFREMPKIEWESRGDGGPVAQEELLLDGDYEADVPWER